MSQSHELRVLLADNAAGTTNPMSFAAKGCDLLGTRRFGSDPGKRGTRQEFDCGSRILGEDVGGGFSCQPTVEQIDWILERLVGDSISSFPATPLVPKETVPEMYAFVDKGAEIFSYTKLRMNTLTIAMREGDYLDFRLDFIGSQELGDQSWPAGAADPGCGTEFITSDAALAIGSTDYSFKSLDLSIDNQISQGQQENKVYRTTFESEGLVIGMNGSFGHRSDTKALYRRGIAGDAGSVTLADGTTTYEFAFANVKIPGNGPVVPEQGEVTKSLNFMCKRTVATDVMTVTKS